MVPQSNHPQVNSLTITIDGPAGAGKSTAAKGLAKALNIAFLDTGAMYRALTLKAMRNNVNLEDEEALAKLAQKTTLDLNNSQILLDGEDVSQEIRTLDVTNNTFYIARATKVREIMVEWQRQIAGKKSIVAEGRDVGTVVFPNATIKFYLDADVNERTERRLRDLEKAGKIVEMKQLLQEVKERDEKDFSRKVGPLKKAEDAIVLDTSGMSVDRMVEEMLKLIKKHHG
jgi:cytidylate kinase